MQSKCETTAQLWASKYWLNHVARIDMLGLSNLMLFTGSDNVTFDGFTKITTEDATPAGEIRNNKIILKPDAANILVGICEAARELGFTPTIWAGFVPGGQEITVSFE